MWRNSSVATIEKLNCVSRESLVWGEAFGLPMVRDPYAGALVFERDRATGGIHRRLTRVHEGVGAVTMATYQDLTASNEFTHIKGFG